MTHEKKAPGPALLIVDPDVQLALVAGDALTRAKRVRLAGQW
jgi:hypothetical protein